MKNIIIGLFLIMCASTYGQSFQMRQWGLDSLRTADQTVYKMVDNVSPFTTLRYESTVDASRSDLTRHDYWGIITADPRLRILQYRRVFGTGNWQSRNNEHATSARYIITSGGNYTRTSSRIDVIEASSGNVLIRTTF